MPGFDKEIARLAQRLLINPRRIDYHTGVLATKVTPGVCSFLSHSSVSQLLTACWLPSTRPAVTMASGVFDQSSCNVASAPGLAQACYHNTGVV